MQAICNVKSSAVERERDYVFDAESCLEEIEFVDGVIRKN